jgi:hypothetical protein
VFHLRSSAVLALTTLFATVAATAGEPIIVPKGDQSQDQLKKDRVECQIFAVDTSGFDPMNPPPPPQAPTVQTGPDGSAVRGAARGAAVGAIGGAIAGDAGKGAAVGAGVGAAGGKMRSNQQKRQVVASGAEAQKQYEDQLAELRSRFDRAFSACMEARDYVVK